MLSLALLSIAAYAATNIDNLFVLLAFLAEGRTRRRQIIVGQFAGTLALIAASALFAAALKQLPSAYIGLLGVLPIGVGAMKGWERFVTKQSVPPDTSPTRESTARSKETGNSSWWTVACVAVANGSDNVAVYIPLYASHTHAQGAWISLVFVAMIGVWCAGSVWLVEHPLLGAPIRRYGTALLPFILVIIGILVIVNNDTPRVLFGI